MPRELARFLAQGLHAAGVRKIFGMPGGGPNLDMIGCAQDVGIDFVLTHGETAACIMASSYGRLTGTPGVAVVTRGPGMTSATNGLAQATLDRFPLLLVTDAVTRSGSARTAHQRLDQVAVAAPVTKWSGVLGTADPVRVVDAAARLALMAPAGAVQLAFDPTTAGDEAPSTQDAARTDPAAFARAGTLLANARRPVVIVGVDAVPHSAVVRDALKDLDCPVLVTYEAKGVVPESWATYAGLFTGASVERPLLEQADAILGIGLDPVEPMPGPWQYTARMVMLHSHEVETAYFGQPLLLVGSYGAALADLVRECQPQWPTGAGAKVRTADLAWLEAETAGLNPLDVVRITQDVVGDVLATVDAGAHMLVAMPVWKTDEPDSVLISNGLATMGFALPAAIAMALARPGRRVVCFVGDGGLSMVLGELETLARLELDVTVVVFDDAMLTLIKLKQTEGQAGSRAVAYQPVDFAAVATGMGVPGRRADTVAELRAALDAPRRGPLLVDAHIDATAYPHIIKITRG